MKKSKRKTKNQLVNKSFTKRRLKSFIFLFKKLLLKICNVFGVVVADDDGLKKQRGDLFINDDDDESAKKYAN